MTCKERLESAPVDRSSASTAAAGLSGGRDGSCHEAVLARRVRFCIPFAHAETASSGGRHNTFAGWPSMTSLGAYYELEVVCAGAADRRTGFVVDITAIDDAVRTHATARIAERIRRDPAVDPRSLLPELVERLQTALRSRIRTLTWQLTPFYSVSIEVTNMDRALLRQQFSFAAAHRLHSGHLSDEDNRRAFGKCNNANGHGHNYRLEVCVSSPLPRPGDAPAFGLGDLERIVDEIVIRRFDHTHLNLDTAEFADVVPTVEHIAKTCHDLLAGPVAEAGGRLEPVTVWETDKTAASYPVG